MTRSTTYLVHGGRDGSLGQELLKVRDLEVADTDRLGEALLHKALKADPQSGQSTIVNEGQWLVDEEQVDIVHADLLQ